MDEEGLEPPLENVACPCMISIERLGVKKNGGVVVTRVEPGSPAADAGIQTGDVIREVNRKPVKDVDDFVQKVEKAKDQDNILLLLQRGQNNLFAAVTPK